MRERRNHCCVPFCCFFFLQFGRKGERHCLSCRDGALRSPTRSGSAPPAQRVSCLQQSPISGASCGCNPSRASISQQQRDQILLWRCFQRLHVARQGLERADLGAEEGGKAAPGQLLEQGHLEGAGGGSWVSPDPHVPTSPRPPVPQQAPGPRRRASAHISARLPGASGCEGSRLCSGSLHGAWLGYL